MPVCYNPPMLRRVIVLALTVGVSMLATETPAIAQDHPAVWPKVLTRGDVEGTGDFLKGSEPNRPLDVRFRAGADLLEAGPFRLPFDFNFDVAFDNRKYPQFADYSLAFTPEVIVGGFAVGLVARHTSRHMHDVLSVQAVAWNSLGARLAGSTTSGRWRLRATVSASKYLESIRSYVDYDWDVVGAGRATYDVSPRTAYYVDGTVRLLQCDLAVAGRDGEVGARIETGANLAFGFGRIDAYVTWDRRIDPAPYARRVADFLAVGLRFRAATSRDGKGRPIRHSETISPR